MKKLISFLIAAVLFTTTACAAGNKVVSTPSTGSGTTTTDNTKGVLPMKLNIQINNGTNKHTLTATLYDNSSSRALVELLQKGAVTIDMHDFSNFEKVGDLPVTLPRNDTPTNTDAGDLILYLGKRFVIYYDKNSWDFTPLGKVDDVTKAELKKILGEGNVTAVLTCSGQ